ncbi:hypothetical protein [Cryptosporangium japonicum]
MRLLLVSVVGLPLGVGGGTAAGVSVVGLPLGVGGGLGAGRRWLDGVADIVRSAPGEGSAELLPMTAGRKLLAANRCAIGRTCWAESAAGCRPHRVTTNRRAQ